MTKPKFKYWDGEFKQMCDVRAIVWHNNMIANIELFDSKTMFRNPNMFYEHALLQYTGLKDSKGREIYEGDIVTHPLCVKEPHDENEPCETFVGRINYETDSGQYFAVNMKRNGYVVVLSEAYKFEVIGNIYENPKLLEGA